MFGCARKRLLLFYEGICIRAVKSPGEVTVHGSGIICVNSYIEGGVGCRIEMKGGAKPGWSTRGRSLRHRIRSCGPTYPCNHINTHLKSVLSSGTSFLFSASSITVQYNASWLTAPALAQLQHRLSCFGARGTSRSPSRRGKSAAETVKDRLREKLACTYLKRTRKLGTALLPLCW